MDTRRELASERRLYRSLGLPVPRRLDTSFTKGEIADAYRKSVAAHGGKVVSQRVFIRETRIRVPYWRGRYWPSWSAFQADLGFVPNQSRRTRIPEEVLLARFAELALEINRLPAQDDLEQRRKRDRSFPSSNPFGRIRRDDFLMKLEAWCKGKPEFAPVARMIEQRRARILARRRDDSTRFRGLVYLVMPYDDAFMYRIGSLRARGARLRRNSVRLGGQARTLHVIDTDDPEGIERYWRQRFKDKRLPNNLYRLLPDDITAFRWRKFQ